MKQNKVILHLVRAILPAVGIGMLSGALASAIVCVYKFCAKYAVTLPEHLVEFLSPRLWLLPLILVLFAGISLVVSLIHEKEPDLCGGGIPASIGTLRGWFRFHWLKESVGCFFLSLLSFLLGVPLGTEGPSVQMGCAMGAGVIRALPEKHRAWERYSMTGGACAGFSVATGAPLSGILFAIEEAHQRISPLIVLVALVSVLFADLTSSILSPLLGVEKALFPALEIPVLSLKEMWIPLLLGLILGLFAVLFLVFYRLLNGGVQKSLKKIPKWVLILSVFVLTLAAAFVSSDFISTGHHLILSLMEESPGVLLLFGILVVRSFLTVGANTVGITGGIFLPILAIGAVAASLCTRIFAVFGIGGEYHHLILALGICAAIAGMMQMPLTAIFFTVEALGCSRNLLPVIITATVAYLIPEVFGVKSTNEQVLERREHRLNQGESVSGEMDLTVASSSFAVGKEVRDIFWPRGVFVLSVEKKEDGSVLRGEDRIHLRYTTTDPAKLRLELTAIAGTRPQERL